MVAILQMARHLYNTMHGENDMEWRKTADIALLVLGLEAEDAQTFEEDMLKIFHEQNTLAI